MKKSDLKKIIAIGAVVTAAAATTAIVVAIHRRNKVLLEERIKTLSHMQAYITGGGISALASALYLVRDCGFNPSNVHLFTNSVYNHGDAISGYICRRGKIVSEKNSMNFFDLVKNVNSLDIPDLTVCDEILNIYHSNSPSRRLTFIDADKNVIDISKIKVSKEDRNAVISLMQAGKKLQNTPLYNAMPDDFFASPFWKLMAAAYGFSKDSNAYEFANCIAHMDDMLAGTIPADFDRYEEILEPLKQHLINLGVDVRSKAVVTDIDFENGKAEAIHFTDNGTRKTFYMNENDICIMPTDEMADCESFGDFNTPAPKMYSHSYDLWDKIAAKNPAIQTPAVFFDETDADMTQEFTITLSNRLLPELIDKVTCSALGNDGVIVLDNSNWKLTICAVPQTHFKDLNEDIAILWGSATRFDRDGEQSGKPMTECSGAEILYEIVSCFNLAEVWDDIRETVINVIPCHRKYGKSFLDPVSSKLEIIPTGIANFAVSGDFADGDNDTVFSEEYSVSTARTAVYTLAKSNKKVFSSKPNSCRDIKKFLKNSGKSLL